MLRQRAILTGASEGIGRQFAIELAAIGFDMTLIARNDSRLQSLLAEISLEKRYHKTVVADLTQLSDLEVVSSEIENNSYQLLINNAGLGHFSDFDTAPIHKIEEMMNLNMRAVVNLSHAYLRNAKPGDALINISSIAGYVPLPDHSLYSATKAFINSFSLSLWREQKKKGVYVAAVCPGATSTQFHIRAGGTKQNKASQCLTQTPHDVVRTAMAALKNRKKPINICGGKNKLIVVVSFLAPYTFLIRLIMHLKNKPAKTRVIKNEA